MTMQIDLENENINLGALPRIQRAPFHARHLITLSSCFTLVGLVLLIVTWKLSPSLWRTLLGHNAAALLVLAAGLESAYAVTRWRCQVSQQSAKPGWAMWRRSNIELDAAAVSTPDTDNHASLTRLEKAKNLITSFIRQCDEYLFQRIGSELVEAFWLGGLSALAWFAVRISWNLSLTGTDLGQTGSVVGGCTLFVAFGLLVLERSFASSPNTEWPEALRLAQLTRVSILVLLLTALSVFFSAWDRVWPARLANFVGIVPCAIAVELLLRAVASTFSRRMPNIEPRLLADSFLASFFHWPIRPLTTLQDELHSRFGINLRQNWAFSFIRRRFFPVLSVIVAIAWVLTGISEIPVEGRGIYERFGKPVRVIGPGLHAGLPWPFSRVIPVENGIVHQLATTVSESNGNAEPETSTADGPAPDTANRLWDASHVGEKTQVIANLSNERQSFQVVNMDLRFVYRIGLTDEAALAATYNSADVPALIRSTANRVVVRDFASRDLDSLLGEVRTQLSTDIGAAVQAELTRLNSGVEILATILGAIHPPAGAANAYHSVQAAQITAIASVARERGNAAQVINDSKMSATLASDKAAAIARENKANAEVANLRFAAEQKAYRTAGKAFLLEQYYSQLSKGLTNGSLIILDHRIGGNLGATVDLRTFAPPSEP